MARHALLATLLAVAVAIFLYTTEAPIEDPLWWLTNDQPPRVTIEGPAGPLRGTADGVVTLNPADRSRIVSAVVDGAPAVARGSHVAVDSAGLPDGTHQVLVTVRDTSRRENQAQATWTFASENTGPRLDVRTDPPNGPQEGRTAVLRIVPSKPAASLTATLGDQPLRVQASDDGSFWALVGVPPDPPSSRLALAIQADDRLGNSSTLERELAVAHTDFAEDNLELDPGMAALLTPRTLDAESARFRPVYAADGGPPRWSGRFRLPVSGDITTEFGTHRSYEYHPGTDFAAASGAPVAAPAPGVVTFEGETQLHGNTLILDHGGGVFTTYAHLQRFEVEPGQSVKTGDIIARVGSTGLSTGPHLHWELWVGGADVDPVQWTERQFP